MTTIIRSQYIWINLALLAGFCLFASLTPVEHVLVLTNSFVLCAAAGAAIRYLPLAIQTIRGEHSAAAQHVAIGIVMASGFSAVWRLWSLIWLQGGRVDGMVQNDIVAALQFGLAIGLLFHVSVPRQDGRYPYWRLFFIGGIITASLVLSAAIIWLNIDTSPLVALVLPYIPR